jgi:hypothetical protein
MARSWAVAEAELQENPDAFGPQSFALGSVEDHKRGYDCFERLHVSLNLLQAL